MSPNREAKRTASHGNLPSPELRRSLWRPLSQPDLFRRGDRNGEEKKKAVKLLLKVTVERSLGAVPVVMPAEQTVAELARAAVEVYIKEGRRPLLVEPKADGYELHYSQFSLEPLNPEEKLINLGSRNFFLCSKKLAVAAATAADCRAHEGKLPSNSVMSSNFLPKF